MSSITTALRRLTTRRVTIVAGVSAVLLAGLVVPSAASSGGGSTSVTITAAVNGVTARPAFTGETSTVALTLKNESLRKLSGYLVVVPKGLGTVANLGVSNAGWSQTKISCGFVSNCSALYLVVAKTSGAQVPQGQTITSSFGVTPPAAGTAQFRILGVGDDSSGLVIVGGQPTITIVDGGPTKLLVSVTPPVIAGQPNNVTVRSVREYPVGSYTDKPFPGALTFAAANGNLESVAPIVPGVNPVTVPLTFTDVQVTPQQTLTANSGAISGSTAFDVVAAGLVVTDVTDVPELVLTGAGGSSYKAKLLKGATGPVSFTEVPCSAVEAECDTEVNLFGNFKNPDGTPRYSKDEPASIEWTCPKLVCPVTERTYGSFDQDQVVDFETYRIQVSLKDEDALNGTGYTDFADAEPCNPKVTTGPGLVGTITDEDAIKAGFCIDVYAITRGAPGSFTGDLTIPVLFFEDPKLRGI